MSDILQPIVAVGQQPMRKFSCLTMQPMVAEEKKRARKEFGRQLCKALLDKGFKNLGPGERGGIAAVYKALRDEKGARLVSPASVRKWIRGEDIPDRTNLRLLCQRLGIPQSKLEPYLEKTDVDGPCQDDARLREIADLWSGLDETKKENVLAIARMAAGNPSPSPSRPRASHPGSAKVADTSVSDNATYSVPSRRKRTLTNDS